MRRSWFVQSGLTESQSLELMERYRKSNYPVERSLSPDLISWEVSVFLPQSATAPRADKTFQQKIWRD